MTSSLAIRNAQLDAATALLSGGQLRIYSGPVPATVESAATGTLLATLYLGTPAFDPASAALAMSTAIAPEISAAAGTAGWFRLWSAGAVAAYYDGTITAPGGGGDLQLDSVTIEAGATVTVDTIVLTRPA